MKFSLMDVMDVMGAYHYMNEEASVQIKHSIESNNSYMYVII